MSDRKARAKAHAKRAYFCKCGRVVHGNGAKAMHFYVNGHDYEGLREGHGQISREVYLERFGHPFANPLSGQYTDLGGSSSGT